MLSLPCRKMVGSSGVFVQNFRSFASKGFGSGFQTAKAPAGIRPLKKILTDIFSKEASDTPFVYGKLALAGGSAVGIGALCYYGLGLSKELGAVDQAALWPQYVRDRINSTYKYLAGGLCLTAGSAVLTFRSPKLMDLMARNSVLALVGTMAAMIGTSMLCQSINYSQNFPAKFLAWTAHCAIMGAILAPLAFVGGPLIMRAAFYTAGIVGGLSTIAVCAPSDKFLNMGGMLGIGFGVVFAASIGSFFLPPNTMMGAGLYSVMLYGGLLLFSAFMLYDTQRLLVKAQQIPRPYYGYGQHDASRHPDPYFDPINSQLSIYMNTLNIFIRMVMILSGGGNRRK